MSEYLIEAHNLSRTLDGEVPVTLVRDAALTIKAGEFVAITGPSGSGKSSLLYLLGLLDDPTTGTLHVAGENVLALSPDKLAKFRLQNMGFVFQSHFLLPEFTALENVMLPMQRLGKISEREIKEKASDILVRLGLGDHLHKLPKQMSGGQCQRVAVGRALANDPVLIMADEPTGNLDTASSKNVQSMFRNIAHEQGRAVVAVTHDPEFAAMADRVIRLVDGRITDLNYKG